MLIKKLTITYSYFASLADGYFVPVGEDGCTHLVIEESYSLDLTTESVKATFVVKQEV